MATNPAPMIAARNSFMAYDWLAILSHALPFNIAACWWAFGEARYGERKAIVEAEDWEGPAYQTCVNASNVAKRFESNRRRLDLTFKHHAEVVALPPAEADSLLDWCEETIQETGKAQPKCGAASFSRTESKVSDYGKLSWATKFMRFAARSSRAARSAHISRCQQRVPPIARELESRRWQRRLLVSTDEFVIVVKLSRGFPLPVPEVDQQRGASNGA
jgi:hypothetical protein